MYGLLGYRTIFEKLESEGAKKISENIEKIALSCQNEVLSYSYYQSKITF